MWMTGKTICGGLAAVALVLLGGAAPAVAATSCAEPDVSGFQRITPARGGFDGAKLQQAIDRATLSTSFAIRVYRNGCLVAADKLDPENADDQYQSWSMAKSMTSLAFMRAMTLGYLQPEDPLGSLITEADQEHGAIRMSDLLTMTSGLKWNGLRDYDVFMPDRLGEALTVPVDKQPGTYWEYSQSGPALLAESVARATGEDFQAFLEAELFGPLGIPRERWKWGRDSKGHTQGFFDLRMLPDDYARLGELMRRGGVWKGRRLIAADIVRRAITPTPTNGCYGWMIWLNRAAPCVGPRVQGRPVDDQRSFPGLPADMYYYSGLFGQLVVVFPTQGVTIVRTGLETGLLLAGGGEYQAKLFAGVLRAITDTPVPLSGDPERVSKVSREDSDRGFQTAVFEPGVYAGGVAPPPLPAAGPARARAVRVRIASRRLTKRGRITVRIGCPPVSRSGACTGTLRLTGAAKPRSFAVAPRTTRSIAIKLSKRAQRRLARRGRAAMTATALATDAAGGTTTTASRIVWRARR